MLAHPQRIMNQLRKRRVCLFGTSADPPTGIGGHLGIAKYLASMDAFDEVRILPVYSHMFGNKRGKQAPFETRVEMCTLLIKNVPKVTVSEVERICFEKAAAGLNEEQKSKVRVGTADILAMLTTNEPNVEFTWALGADTFLDLASGKWRRTDEVFELVGHRMVVFKRLFEGTDLGKGKINDGKKYEQDHDKLLRESAEKWSKLDEDGNPTIRIVSIPSLTDASSSTVRKTSDEIKLQELLTDDVLSFVKEKKMYSFSDSNISNEED
mmetsp:Transcript_1925/g.4206  ORF Transcript_1925/g.4206 Transcript_1925/m.4206 type:complete len:267 (-) Transcript_1925:3-803(-)